MLVDWTFTSDNTFAFPLLSDNWSRSGNVSETDDKDVAAGWAAALAAASITACGVAIPRVKVNIWFHESHWILKAVLVNFYLPIYTTNESWMLELTVVCQNLINFFIICPTTTCITCWTWGVTFRSAFSIQFFRGCLCILTFFFSVNETNVKLKYRTIYAQFFLLSPSFFLLSHLLEPNSLLFQFCFPISHLEAVLKLIICKEKWLEKISSGKVLLWLKRGRWAESVTWRRGDFGQK